MRGDSWARQTGVCSGASFQVLQFALQFTSRVLTACTAACSVGTGGAAHAGHDQRIARLGCVQDQFHGAISFGEWPDVAENKKARVLWAIRALN